MTFNPAASASASSGASKADFDSKLKALEDREATLTQKDADRSAEWEKKMKEVQDRQDSLAKEEKDRAESYEKRLQELQSREAEVAKKEEQQKSAESGSNEPDKTSQADKRSEDNDSKAQAEKEKEEEIQRKLDDLKSTEQKIAADRASLGKSKADFTAKLEWFQQRQKSFEDQKSSAQHDAVQAKKDLEQRHKEIEGQKSSSNKKTPQEQGTAKSDYSGQNGTQDGDLEKKQRENADLEKRLARLEDQLAHMNASEGKSEKPKVNGTVSKGAEGCGYKHYKPPRKLNRKVIGIVYA